MKQHSIHSKMIRQVAERLGSLRPKVVFLGGSAVGFHITDSAEPEVRATKLEAFFGRGKGDYLVSHDNRI